MSYSSNAHGDNSTVCRYHNEDMELVSMSPDGEGTDYICWSCWNEERNGPLVYMIWAQTQDGVIGDGDKMPWASFREDLKRFSELTHNSPVIMGRKTWESLPDNSRPLDNRTNIVVTSNTDYVADGAIVANSADNALTIAKSMNVNTNRIWIIGGSSLYEEFMPIADTVYVTELLADAPDGFTVHTPVIPENDFFSEETNLQSSDSGRINGEKFNYKFVTYRRKHEAR